jgi:class 3 adenylate cyclase
MSGFEVCRAIRAEPATATLPVVMVTALDPVAERVRGLEAGADDFLAKPINQAELLVRVRSLLRIKQLHDQVQSQAAELAQWNATLTQRVAEQVEQIGRLGRLKRFFSPKLAELIVSGGADDPLVPHRREIVVVFLDLRGFTAFAEAATPDEVMGVLREYHLAVGELILGHDGTLERFGGDSIMVFFNDPVPVERPAEPAARMACAIRQRFGALARAWAARGHRLGLGVGIAQGGATLGAIGFEGRWDYAAIGAVTNRAARLCSEAADGQILIDSATARAIEGLAQVEAAGERGLKGFARPVATFNLQSLEG